MNKASTKNIVGSLLIPMLFFACSEGKDIEVTARFYPEYVENRKVGFDSVLYDEREGVVYAGLGANIENFQKAVVPIMKWDPLTNEHLDFSLEDIELERIYGVTSVGIGCEKDRVVSSIHDGRRWEYIVLWDSEEGKPLKTVKTLSINDLEVSCLHKVIVSGGLLGVLEFWDAETLELRHQIKLPADPVQYPHHPGALIQSIDLSPDERYLAVATGRMHSEVDKSTFFRFGKLYILDMESLEVRELESVPAKLGDGLRVVRYSPDGKYIAAGGGDRRVYVWDAETGKIIKKFKKHKDWVSAIAFTPNGRYIAVADMRRKFRIYDFETGKVVFKSDTIGREKSVEFSPDGKLMITKSSKGRYSNQQILIWDVSSLN